MQSKRKYKIPDAFKNKPFFINKTYISEQPLGIREAILNEPFYFDILHTNNVSLAILPWLDPKEYVPIILDIWRQLTIKVKEGFRNRDNSIQNEELLIVCLSLFILALHWSNKRPIKTLKITEMELNNFLRKPFNCEERLQYIMDKPTQFHAFIQLEQLFIELEKSFSKAIALKQV